MLEARTIFRVKHGLTEVEVQVLESKVLEVTFKAFQVKIRVSGVKCRVPAVEIWVLEVEDCEVHNSIFRAGFWRSDAGCSLL